MSGCLGRGCTQVRNRARTHKEEITSNLCHSACSHYIPTKYNSIKLVMRTNCLALVT